MVYRRQLLMGLLQALGGSVTDEDFQIFVYLLTRMQPEPMLQFSPTRQGPYSFEMRHDHRMMIAGNILADIPTQWSSAEDKDYFTPLRARDKQMIGDLLFEVGPMSPQELRTLLYERHPFLAMHLPYPEEFLNEDQLLTLRQYQFKTAKPQLYTIGYEGRHVEEYLNDLLQNRVRYVVDTRRNAYSMKFGFKKSQLESELAFVGIGYEHLRDLGVESAKRKGAESEKDWDRIFREYELETLPRAGEALARVRDLMASHGRVALTCYERAPQDCHRLRVVYALQAMQGWEWDVVHL